MSDEKEKVGLMGEEKDQGFLTRRFTPWRKLQLTTFLIPVLLRLGFPVTVRAGGR